MLFVINILGRMCKDFVEQKLWGEGVQCSLLHSTNLFKNLLDCWKINGAFKILI